MFQSSVGNIQALGNAGQVSKANHSFCNIVAVLAADDNVAVGSFVQAKSNATNENEVVGASGQAITGEILGVVVRDSLKNSGGVSATLSVAKGEPCQVLNEGSIFIECDGAVAKGSYVFLKESDGSLAFDTSSTKSDYAYTGFRVSKGNASGKGIIEITTARA